jgi:arsenite methyltransferase
LLGGLPCAAWKKILEEVGFVDVTIGAPVDTFQGASGAKNARKFQVFSYPFLARKP